MDNKEIAMQLTLKAMEAKLIPSLVFTYTTNNHAKEHAEKTADATVAFFSKMLESLDSKQ